MRMREFFDEARTWSWETFGDPGERGSIGPLKHLAKEVQECLDKPHDIIEYADMMHLLVDAVWRAGFNYEEFKNACRFKLDKNKRRSWPKPTADGVIEHIQGVND